MEEIIIKCDELYYNSEECKDKYSNEYKFDCHKCLENSFYNKELDTYSCLKKLSLYTKKFGRLYVEEIYHFLNTSKILDNMQGKLNILSLGAGFCPDNIALKKYINDKKLNLEYNYYGFDIEPKWREIRDDKNINFAEWRTNPSDKFEVLPKIRSVLYDMNLASYDIVFINKLFSTLCNHNKQKVFLDKFNTALETLPQRSYIIFNDRNEYNIIINKFEEKLNKNIDLLERYFIEKPCSPHLKDFKEIKFDYIPSNEYEKKSKNQTNFFIYQKR